MTATKSTTFPSQVLGNYRFPQLYFARPVTVVFHLFYPLAHSRFYCQQKNSRAMWKSSSSYFPLSYCSTYLAKYPYWSSGCENAVQGVTSLMLQLICDVAHGERPNLCCCYYFAAFMLKSYSVWNRLMTWATPCLCLSPDFHLAPYKSWSSELGDSGLESESHSKRWHCSRVLHLMHHNYCPAVALQVSLSDSEKTFGSCEPSKVVLDGPPGSSAEISSSLILDFLSHSEILHRLVWAAHAWALASDCARNDHLCNLKIFFAREMTATRPCFDLNC